MDRRIVNPGQLPLETDLLKTNQDTMTALAVLSRTVLGTDGAADGFSCLPTAPASNTVVISSGSVYQMQQLESSTYSSLPPDTHQVLKQGIALDGTTLTLIPPATVGYGVNVLIQVQYADFDDNAAIRPYYNAANPAQPFAGPGNSNQPQPQTRKGIVSVQQKYGVAAIVGSQATPTPDAGWIGLFVVTLAYGQTAITGGNIVPYALARTVLAKLPTVPSSIQGNVWTYSADSSATVNFVALSPQPPLLSYQTGTKLQALIGNTNTDIVTVNVSNLGPRNLKRRDGTPLIAGDIIRGSVVEFIDNGTEYRLQSLAQGEVPRIVPNAILYVRTDGNDNSDGTTNTATGAFATIAAAVARAAIAFVTGGNGTGLIVQLGIPGTYAAPLAGLRPNGNVTIQGDLANQQNYIIQGGTNGAASGAVIAAAGGGSLTLQGLTLQNVGSSLSEINMNGSINVICRNVTFASVLTNSAFHATVGPGTTLTIQPGCLFSGNMAGIFYSVGGAIYLGASVLTLVGTPTFTTATVVITNAGQIVSAGATFSGSATGTRYAISVNGVAATNGAGANYFPGSVAGTTTTGGQYV